MYGIGEPDCLKNTAHDDVKSVAIVSNLASEKSEDFISQSMKNCWTESFPAKRMKTTQLSCWQNLLQISLRIETDCLSFIPSSLRMQHGRTSYTYTESDALNSSASLGMNLGLNAGVNASHGQTSQNYIMKKDSDGTATKVKKGLIGKGKQLIGLYAPNKKPVLLVTMPLQILV